MSEFKGTKGPWAGMVDGRYLNTDWIANTDEFDSYEYAPVVDSNGRTICLVVHGFEELANGMSTVDGNARLIAAAPEMFEALKPFAACAEDLDGYPEDLVDPVDDDEWVTFRLTAADYRRARAAIDRALGEEEK